MTEERIEKLKDMAEEITSTLSDSLKFCSIIFNDYESINVSNEEKCHIYGKTAVFISVLLDRLSEESQKAQELVDTLYEV